MSIYDPKIIRTCNPNWSGIILRAHGVAWFGPPERNFAKYLKWISQFPIEICENNRSTA